MKKHLVAIMFCLAFIQTHPIQKRPYRNLDKLYDQAMSRIQIQLAKANLVDTERRNLITRLTNYFLANGVSTPTLNNTKIEVLYGAITKSYQQLLQKAGTKTNLPERFKEQVIGKILLQRK